MRAFMWVGLLGACSGSPEEKDPVEDGPVFELLDPGAEHYGQSYGNWGAQWSIWGYGLQTPDHPWFDETGEFCEAGQSGPVFFLMGNWGEVSHRSCTVGADKALFFPLYNWQVDNIFADESTALTDEELLAQLDASITSVQNMTLQIEDQSWDFEELLAYRGISEAFSYELPPEPNVYNEWGIDGYGDRTVSPSYSDGYWAMLDPLPKGPHTVHFTAAAPGAYEGETWTLDVTYDLTVQ